MTPRPGSSLKDRFWKRVEFHGKTDCWPWCGYRDKAGYSRIQYGDRTHLAHRVAWLFTNGPIPVGLCVLHHCDFPSCCNPAHLFLGTQTDNMADRDKKGRQASGQRNGSYTHSEKRPRGNRNGSRLHPERLARGESHGISKLADEQVSEIRHIFVRSSRAFGAATLGRKYGVSHKTILAIITGRTWRHLLEETSVARN